MKGEPHNAPLQLGLSIATQTTHSRHRIGGGTQLVVFGGREGGFRFGVLRLNAVSVFGLRYFSVFEKIVDI